MKGSFDFHWLAVVERWDKDRSALQELGGSSTNQVSSIKDDRAHDRFLPFLLE